MNRNYSYLALSLFICFGIWELIFRLWIITKFIEDGGKGTSLFILYTFFFGLSYYFSFLLVFRSGVSLHLQKATIFVYCVTFFSLSLSVPLAMICGSIYLFTLSFFSPHFAYRKNFRLIVAILLMNIISIINIKVFPSTFFLFIMGFSFLSIIVAIFFPSYNENVVLQSDLTKLSEQTEQTEQTEQVSYVDFSGNYNDFIKIKENRYIGQYYIDQSKQYVIETKNKTDFASIQMTSKSEPIPYKYKGSNELSNLGNKKEIASLSQIELITRHQTVISKLQQEEKQLSEEIAYLVQTICQYADSIIMNMRYDERDFKPGNRFLTRYLPATQQILNNFINLSSKLEDEIKIKNLEKKVYSSLKQLMHAFIEKNYRLLENDFTDLDIEINTIDKLLKMEGFKTGDQPKP